MRKFYIILMAFFILPICFLCGCNKTNSLSAYVTELNYLDFYGESENYKLKAFYGYRESPFMADGLIGEKIYGLCFILQEKEMDQAKYMVSFNYNNTEYKTAFMLTNFNNLSAFVEIENFDLTTFEASIIKGENIEKVTLNSTIPSDTIDSKTALEILCEKQQSLIKQYYDQNGNFNGEIHQRIIIKDDKAYWYFSIMSSEKNKKALLLDGKDGTLIAVRDILR